MSGADAKQRLMAINVGEVSLVDNAANETEFLVVKSVTDSGLKGDDALQMLEQLITKHSVDKESAEKLRGIIKNRTTEAPPMTTPNKDEPVNKAGGVLLDPYTALTVTTGAIRDCTWALSDMLREGNIAGATAKVEEIKTMLDSAQQLATQVTKSVTDFSTAIGSVVETVTKGADGKKGKMPDWMKEQMKALQATVAKWLADEGDTGDVAKSVEDILAEVIKGGKAQFSKERLAKLKASLGDLAGMVKEADADGFAAWHASLNPAPAPDAGVAKSAPAAAPAVSDAAVADIKKSLDGITAGLGELKGRLEAVEKASATTKADPNEGTQNVSKGKGLWHGVV